MKLISFLLLSGAATFACAQQLGVPTTAWNSSVNLTSEQISQASISPELASALAIILNFDHTQLANGGPSQDAFYDLTVNASNLPPTGPGQVIKVQQFTDPTPYNIPAKTALSRFIYSSTNINGSLVPASAYVLWPYTPKKLRSHSKAAWNQTKAPVVLWTHGTSGFFADGAPSAHRSLFYGDIVPFTLAQAGYTVIATDYAGLGVQKSWDGSFVQHQYTGREAGAADALNALRAARKIFPDLITEEYVVMGHSQGGAVAWGVSEALADKNQHYEDVEKDHLGTIVCGPGIGGVSLRPGFFLPLLAPWLTGVFPGFTLSAFLTPTGINRAKLLKDVEGGQFFAQLMFTNDTENINPNWMNSWYADALLKMVNPGDLPYKGPMLLIQGDQDPATQFNITTATYNSTREKYPGDFELMVVPEGGHFTSIDATRQIWLKWIESRFEGLPVKECGCVQSQLESFLPVDRYQALTKSFFQWSGNPAWFYQLPAGSS